MARSRNRNRSQRAQRVSRRRVHMRRNSRKNQKSRNLRGGSRNRNARRSRRVRRRSNLKMRGGDVENVGGKFNALPDVFPHEYEDVAKTNPRFSLDEAAKRLFNQPGEFVSELKRPDISDDSPKEYTTINFVYKGAVDQYDGDNNTFTLYTSEAPLTKEQREKIAPGWTGGDLTGYQNRKFRVTKTGEILKLEVEDKETENTWYPLIEGTSQPNTVQSPKGMVINPLHPEVSSP